MAGFTVTVLGSGSAVPTPERNASGQLVSIGKQKILIDCSEGTLVNMRKAGLNPMQIDYVCISHLHGDHYFGLPGLITGMHLMGRKSKLHIAGPPGLYEIISMQLKTSETDLRYELIFTTLTDEDACIVAEGEGFKISSFPLMHRIPVWGFLVTALACGKMGHDIHAAQERHSKPLTTKSYAYCTDTVICREQAKLIQGVDVLYHEATFISIHQKEARATFHSTAAEAAQMAVLSEAQKLMLGHFSGRYPDVQVFLDEAREIFPNTILAHDGLVLTI
jgi:ribonuclease Z